MQADYLVRFSWLNFRFVAWMFGSTRYIPLIIDLLDVCMVHACESRHDVCFLSS